MKKLTEVERTQFLTELSDWRMHATRDALHKLFVFKDFNAAFGFMTRVALYAEQHDHHPEWLNIWNKVEVTLITHDVAGLSMRDIEMARFMDGLAQYAKPSVDVP